MGPLDGMMTLRIFGKSDEVLAALLQELALPRLTSLTKMPKFHVAAALVPYDADGRLLPAGGGPRMWLDLSDRRKVRITSGHNIQGAKQPKFMHIGAKKAVRIGGVMKEPAEGRGF